MVNDTDRVYFLLAPLPNNRLQTGSRPPFCGWIRKLDESDINRPALATTVPSLDRITWADRHFDAQASGERCSYLLESGRAIVGYLTISQSRRDGFHIDEVAVSPAHQGHGYGGILLRFADTLARHSGHGAIQLMAIEDKVPLYEKLGYRPLSDKPTIRLPNATGASETYIPMSRPILYHVKTEMDQ